MAVRDIKDKLRLVLREKSITEIQVVYIMAEIRKLIDHQHLRKRYETLAFYCDWALHTSMDRSGALRLIKMFDELIESKAEDGGPVDISGKIGAKIDKLTEGAYLYNDLKRFLKYNDLPSEICDDIERWHKFLEEYGKVITDCPLAGC